MSLRERWREWRESRAEDAAAAEEMRFHIEQETARNIRFGMKPKAARRAAMSAFGGIDRYREQARDERGGTRLSDFGAISWLDLKLGARMLIKYPVLTLIGGLGIAVGVAVGAACFAFSYSFLLARLPLDEGARVIGIENWDASWNNQDNRSLHDFATWRDELKSVEDVSAFRAIERNLIVPGGLTRTVRFAEMTASGFRVARVPPLLGRPLLKDDERKGAPAVIVIGHDEWRRRFASDPGIVGREVKLGNTVHTVVGVMPEGFAFPVNFSYWTPLRAQPSDYARRRGPELTVFGRLAPGATLDEAQAEVTTIGGRTAAAFPETHKRIRPRVVPYMVLFFDDVKRWQLHLAQLFVSLLLVIISVNVAILVYARTAARQGEIAVRSALGASRHRIVAQLFVEALVLAAVGAVLGLVLARVALVQGFAVASRAFGGKLPFWADDSLSAGAVAYALGLTVFAAAIVGVVPALQATGRKLQSQLRQMGGGTGMQLGKTWTTLIVVQVAFVVAVLPPAVAAAWEAVRYATFESGFASDEFLTARLVMERETVPSAEAQSYQREFAARFANRVAELVRQLQAEQNVLATTVASGIPGIDYEAVSIEVDGVPLPAEFRRGYGVGVARVDLAYFDAFDVPILSGRSFNSADLDSAANRVIVNRSFVQEILGGANVLGRRVRDVGVFDGDEDTWADARGQARKPGPWYEIVGVVGDLPANPIEPGRPQARMYRPTAPGQFYPAVFVVRMAGADPMTFAARLRELTAAIDPTLQLRQSMGTVGEITTLEDRYRAERVHLRLTAWAVGLGTLSVLLVSAAGIYALMSVTVSQRRREIGIRAALGADPRRILGSIFSRALGQLAIGVVLGLVAAASLYGRSLMSGETSVILSGVSALMMAMGLIAAVGPVRRGLRIQPTEALRTET